MAKNKLLVKGIYWNLLKTFFERILLLVQQLILARLLFPEDFGIYSKITSAFSLISFFSYVGVSEFLLSRKKNIRLWFPILNTYWLFLLVISFFLIVLFVKFTPSSNENFSLLVFIYSVSLPFNSYKTSDLVLLNFIGKYKTIAISRILFTISLVIFSLTLAFLKYGIFSLVISYVLSCLIEFSYLRYRTNIGFKVSKSYKKLKILFLNGMRLAGHIFSWRIINSFDFFIIGYILDDIKAGLYFMAFSLAVQPISLLMSYLPGLLYSSNLREDLSIGNVINRSNSFSFYLVFFSSPIFVYTYFYSDFLIPIFLGNKWIVSIGVLKVLSISMIPRVFSSQWHLKYLHSNEYKNLSKLSFMFLLIHTISFCFLTYYFDLIGAALSTGILYIIITFSDWKNIYFSNKYLLSVFKSVFLSFLIFYLMRKIAEAYSDTIFIVLITSILCFILYLILSVFFDKNVSDLKKKLIKSLKFSKK